MPEVIHIEATGLGGKDLGVEGPWDISIRTDPEGQNVYGPSLATVEDIVIEPCQSGGTSTKHVTSLGMSKATHEFLTLHYFALDSAEWWERILGELLPNAQFPAAVIRRTFAYQMFMAAHIAPSHRRPPHPVLLWSIRGVNGQFSLVDPWSGNYFDLEATKFMEPIGLEHFFDAFSLDRKRLLKVDAAAALHIPLNDVSDSLVVKQDRANRFELTPV